jgi:hypothetical protein
MIKGYVNKQINQVDATLKLFCNRLRELNKMCSVIRMILMRGFIHIAILFVFYTYNIGLFAQEFNTDKLTMPGLRAILLDMVNQDQEHRKTTTDVFNPSVNLIQSIKEISETNAERLNSILTKTGIPNRSMIGDDGLQAFWLLAHNCKDYNFQRILRQYVESGFIDGSISGKDYARYIDRIIVHDSNTNNMAPN